MRKIILPMLAGETHYVTVPGDFIYQVQGGNITVVVDDADTLDFCVGISAKIKKGFSKLSVTTVYAQTVVLIVGHGFYRDDRSADKAHGLSLTASACLGSAFVPGNTLTGQYPTVMLGNPLNSGVNVLLRAVSFSSSTSALQAIMTSSLLSAVAAGLAVVANSTASSRVGGPPPKAQVSGGNIAAGVGLSFSANVITDRRELITPIIIPQGYGLLFCLAASNTSTLCCTFEWTEEATPLQAAP